MEEPRRFVLLLLCTSPDAFLPSSVPCFTQEGPKGDRGPPKREPKSILGKVDTQQRGEPLPTQHSAAHSQSPSPILMGPSLTVTLSQGLLGWQQSGAIQQAVADMLGSWTCSQAVTACVGLWELTMHRHLAEILLQVT